MLNASFGPSRGKGRLVGGGSGREGGGERWLVHGGGGEHSWISTALHRQAGQRRLANPLSPTV